MGETLSALFALAFLVGLPLAGLLLFLRFRPGRRARRGPADLAERLHEVEQVAIFHEDQIADLQRRITALEQAQALLYQVQ